MSVFEPLLPGHYGGLHDYRWDLHGVGMVMVRGSELIRADPVVLMSRELFEMWHTDGPPPVGDLGCDEPSRPGIHVGDVVRINGTNRRAVYVVRGVLRENPDALVLRWPD